jgi:hypothetical protein
MDCVKVCEQLCSYLDNEMEPPMRMSFEEHIATCEKCNREIETCRCIKSRVQNGLQSVKAPEFLRKKISIVLERAEDYRESGIDALDLIKWGTHFAQLYNNKVELSEILVPYMTKGLEENEQCLWITSDISISEAQDSIIGVSPNIKAYLDEGQLEIMSYKDWYFFNGYFNGEAVLDSTLKKYNDAISNGYSGLRIAGTTYWMEQDLWDAVMDLEYLINDSLSDEKMLLVCSYKQNGCSKDKIDDVINTHKYVLFKSDGYWKTKKSCLD